tara:strand:- start:529 stop:747 length:219 start_codon:yes stop_codon:yes gene_type:complete
MDAIDDDAFIAACEEALRHMDDSREKYACFSCETRKKLMKHISVQNKQIMELTALVAILRTDNDHLIKLGRN